MKYYLIAFFLFFQFISFSEDKNNVAFTDNYEYYYNYRIWDNISFITRWEFDRIDLVIKKFGIKNINHLSFYLNQQNKIDTDLNNYKFDVNGRLIWHENKFGSELPPKKRTLS